ncbi:biotin--[acetyl-CoA-carboxylase] ligase [Alkalicoccus urumqiensis]|uniref:Bifunctional ligase/repressor BirA n=1 Tax=Alkalicoccus urumqiensis TaxID=1548213 RepID=A0A2P6MKL9_ALKUR|nr:biotin--[acetyl-CoA-carboxylase] ligase [Alkalicoccus urumqiensis]PRO66839.1 biotin--[acetyl-CoA-carboxylase] ligase [Alkalicoccus urumqiensis]
MKGEILKMLSRAEGYTSGEHISEQLGISRTGVWKHIQSLREEGYTIVSVRKKGYRLEHSGTGFSAHAVSSKLRTEGIHIEHHEKIPSTQTRAQRLAQGGARGWTVVTADEQTGGRGRRGRPWSTKKGTALAASIILRLDKLPQEAAAITPTAAVIINDVLQRYGVDTRIKWPNDILAEGRKVCGILTEMHAEMDELHYLIIGIGVNVNETDFPEEIKPTAVSLRHLTGQEWDRSALLAALLDELKKRLPEFEENGFTPFREDWLRYSTVINKEITIHQRHQSWKGRAVDIREDGRLIVETETGQKEVISGDISI